VARCELCERRERRSVVALFCEVLHKQQDEIAFADGIEDIDST
jgi:hypothetical protein